MVDTRARRTAAVVDPGSKLNMCPACRAADGGRAVGFSGGRAAPEQHQPVADAESGFCDQLRHSKRRAKFAHTLHPWCGPR